MQYKYVFGYLRLSNDDEDKRDESNSIANQRLLIQHYIEDNEEFSNAYIQFWADDGYSGTNYNRPNFKKMMNLVKSRKPCTVIVKDLSRLGRDTITTQDYIEKIFPFLQVRFIAINDGYDSDSSYSNRKDSEVKFKNLVNGIYPEICSKNIKQVFRKYAEAGRYWGSVPPYGYLFTEETPKKLAIDKETAPIVRLIFDRRLAGIGHCDIARELEEKKICTPAVYLRSKGFNCLKNNVRSQWTIRMVKKILENPVYTGVMASHKTERKVVASHECISIPKEEWIYVEGAHEAIVSKEEQQRIVAMIKHQKRDSSKKKKRDKYLFSGKIKCGHCNRAVRIRREFNPPRISCGAIPRKKDSACFEGVSSMAPIEEMVLQLVRRQASITEDTLKQIKQMNEASDVSKLEKKKGTYEKQLEICSHGKMELYEKFASGNLSKDDYLNRKEKIYQKESQYMTRVNELQEKIIEIEARKKKEDSQRLKIFSQYKDLETLSYPIVQELIKVIYFYDPEHIEVIWNYQDEFMEIM